MMAAEADREATLRRQVREEQIAILFRQTPFTLVTNSLLSVGLAWVLWNDARHQTLLIWCAAILLLVLARLGLIIGFRRRNSASRIPWQTWLTLATVLSGAVWGTAGLLFFLPASPVALIFVTIVLAGIAAGSVPAYSCWPPAQYSAIPTALPIALRYLYEGGRYDIMGLMCILFLLNVLVSARQLSRVLLESIRLRLEKQELVQQLHEEKHIAESARQDAEEANLTKSRFLAAASHDLRQPLHAANLFVAALRHESGDARADKVLDHLGAAIQSSDDLLDELLEMSRLDAGLIKPQCQVLDLQRIFEGLAQELRPVADEKGIELGFVATRLKVMSDAHMLGRILRNIVTNAIRHTEHGAVLVGCRRRGNDVAIAVYDTGPGIAPEHHAAIFREFYQLGNPERDRRKGLGLGLAIVDGLCRILGHTVSLRSTPGRGTAFFVQAPRVADDTVQQESAPEAPPPDLSGCAVLVIDDEPTICEGMTELLTRWGCRVLAAESAEEAVRRLTAERFDPDVIIADYRLREGHTGTEAIARVRRALDRPVPAAILTGDTAPERLREASASGCLLLHKPLQAGRLREALNSLRAKDGTQAPGQSA
jgi:two-component system, sensor histidine kinase